MFKLFSKKLTKPVIHPDLYKNAVRLVDQTFDELLKDDEAMEKFYAFHYGEKPPTPAHLQFSIHIVSNLWQQAKDKLVNQYKDEFKLFTGTLEFSYTPYIETGKVVAAVHMRSLLTWRASNHEEWGYEKAEGSQDQ